MDLAAPTHWTLITRPGQFEFMIQPPVRLLPRNNYIPKLMGQFAYAPAPVPIVGKFSVYSMEAAKKFPAFSMDHRNGTFPVAPQVIQVDAPNSSTKSAKIYAFSEPAREAYKYI